MRLNSLNVQPIKGEYKGKINVFRLEYINDKEKLSEKFFSVDNSELYNVWIAKIRQTL